jgi:hypothetical protein
MPAAKIPYGAPALGAALPLTTGTYYFVHSGTGSNGNTGLKPERPFATVQAAVTAATASKNDVIVVLPGHAETVTASSLNLSKAGVSVICLGNGRNAAVFTYGAAAATITVSAANVSWKGGNFVANFADVAAAFTIGAAKGFRVECASFTDTSAILNFLSIVVTGSTNNDADGLSIVGCYWYSLATTANAFVSILANNLRVLITDNIVDKAATNDAGQFITLSSKIVGGIRILRNVLTVVGSTGAAVGVFLTGSGTTSSGIIAYNLVSSLDTTGALIGTAGTGIAWLENYMTGAVDKSGTLHPAADNPA